MSILFLTNDMHQHIPTYAEAMALREQLHPHREVPALDTATLPANFRDRLHVELHQGKLTISFPPDDGFNGHHDITKKDLFPVWHLFKRLMGEA